MGIDLVELAKRGIEVIGIDLTEKAIDLACKHFKEKKLQAKFKVANAESLPFKNEEFDLVYSFGVLHHTPNTQKAIDEIFRVLKPGGGAYIMLYHKNSLNYLVHRILNYPY
jgi:ubiquinone/menaquinone biosynthesis C-methylase UbiE